MYYRLIPILAMVVVVCCLVSALASAFGGQRIGYGGLYPPIFVGPSWSHGGYYHGSSGGGGILGPSGGSSGRSPSGGFSGGGTTGGHGGK
jgi:hypothetical protein